MYKQRSTNPLKQYRDILLKSPNPGQHRDLFELFLKRADGETQEKVMAVEVLCTFAKYFPDLEDDVVEKLIDLCEDDDLQIRLNALRWFPTMIENVPSEIVRLGDVLLQLMSSVEDQEVTVVQQSLDTLFDINPLGTLDIFFYHVHISDPATRVDTLNLLRSKLPRIRNILNENPRLEMYLLKKIKGMVVNV
eukprot:TRINITY_DN7668_c1_g2_i1.p1 TRINITY_DN7668_c1_g2~~TRINITY_DN7668_c1_g2_i1.p1  ORF type:complete len:205 (+),score=30.61 TRINITY_DN7668_c1_g2_i1:42-617(+)